MWSFVKIAKYLFKDFKYSWLIEEFDRNIHKELDFVHEAGNMGRLKKLIEKEKIKNILVPKVLLEPTKKLLVMEFIHGYHIDEV
jgi:predicted unusual protein kinase regulating ubiquinone biosynthesis (AarF/ABC1/UbiB family)